jgi:hypothetical protein
MPQIPQQQPKRKRISVRAVFDLVMGFIYAAVGGALVVSKYIGLKLAFPPPEMLVAFGSVSVLYGAFRIYRGVKSFYSAEL